MSFCVDRIDHVEVFVRDIETSIAWYDRVLGLKETFRWDPHPIMIGAGKTTLALFKGDKNAAAPISSSRKDQLHWRRVAWIVEPERFGTAQEHLRACGVTFEGPIDHDIGESIYFSDPDGHPLEITCYPKK